MLRTDGGGAFHARLSRLIGLTEKEAAVVAGLEGQRRLLSRGSVLDRDGGPQLWVLQQGWAATCLSLPDGNRQIVQVHLPGDLIGPPDGVSGHRAEARIALTEITASPVPRAALAAAFAEHPRLAALLFVLARLEQRGVADRMASIGRTDARARLGALLLDFAIRLRAAGIEPNGNGYPLPLTQEEIGDAIGLTAVHVNRMMRVLAEDGLIARGPGTVRLLDEARLARQSGHMGALPPPDLSWLPEAR